MSDLSATNCGCNNCGNRGLFGGMDSCIWIILLLVFCGGCGEGRLGFGNNRCDEGNNMSCIWIIILLFCCGGCGF